MTGAELIADERARQMEAEGFDDGHDDEHTKNELAWAAIAYAAPAPIWRDTPGFRGTVSEGSIVDPFPWADEWDRRPSIWDDGECSSADRQRALVKAGALIAAEWDRLERAKLKRALENYAK